MRSPLIKEKNKSRMLKLSPSKDTILEEPPRPEKQTGSRESFSHSQNGENLYSCAHTP